MLLVWVRPEYQSRAFASRLPGRRALPRCARPHAGRAAACWRLLGECPSADRRLLIDSRRVQMVAAQDARLARDEQGLAEAAATLAVLDAKMRHSSLTLSMLDACMFAEAGPIVCRMSMMAIQPLLSFHNVRPVCASYSNHSVGLIPVGARADAGWPFE